MNACSIRIAHRSFTPFVPGNASAMVREAVLVLRVALLCACALASTSDTLAVHFVAAVLATDARMYWCG